MGQLAEVKSCPTNKTKLYKNILAEGSRKVRKVRNGVASEGDTAFE